MISLLILTFINIIVTTTNQILNSSLLTQLESNHVFLFKLCDFQNRYCNPNGNELRGLIEAHNKIIEDLKDLLARCTIDNFTDRMKLLSYKAFCNEETVATQGNNNVQPNSNQIKPFIRLVILSDNFVEQIVKIKRFSSKLEEIGVFLRNLINDKMISISASIPKLEELENHITQIIVCLQEIEKRLETIISKSSFLYDNLRFLSFNKFDLIDDCSNL